MLLTFANEQSINDQTGEQTISVALLSIVKLYVGTCITVHIRVTKLQFYKNANKKRTKISIDLQSTANYS